MENDRIIDLIKEGKRQKIRVYPQHVVRASEIGHPCERYLVFSILKWNERQPHAPEVEFIFEGGRLVEELALQDFRDAGFRVYQPEPDKAIMESKPRITGHVDIRVDFGDKKIYTGEIKGLNVYDFERLNNVEDFFKSKKPWIKKYPAQLMTYLYIKGEERGFFYLKSIPRFQPKLIWVDLDLSYMESLLQKTERIERCVVENVIPEPIEWDENICGSCAFRHICSVEMKRTTTVIEDGPELFDKLTRHEELKALVKEYDEIDRELKEIFKEKEKVICGDYLVTGKWIEKQMSAKEATIQRYWQTKISKL